MNSKPNKPNRTADEILQSIREGARRGGLARSAKKARTSRKNLKLANQARIVARA